MTQRTRSVLQIVAQTNMLAWFVRNEQESDANVAWLIPDYLRVRESFAGH